MAKAKAKPVSGTPLQRALKAAIEGQKMAAEKSAAAIRARLLGKH